MAPYDLGGIKILYKEVNKQLTESGISQLEVPISFTCFVQLLVPSYTYLD